MTKTIRVFLGLGLLGVMLASTVPSFASPQSKKKTAKKGKSSKSSKKGGRGGSQ